MSNVIKLNGYDVRDPHGVHFDSADGLTDAQQAQARQNVGAASTAELGETNMSVNGAIKHFSFATDGTTTLPSGDFELLTLSDIFEQGTLVTDSTEGLVPSDSANDIRIKADKLLSGGILIHNRHAARHNVRLYLYKDGAFVSNVKVPTADRDGGQYVTKAEWTFLPSYPGYTYRLVVHLIAAYGGTISPQTAEIDVYRAVSYTSNRIIEPFTNGNFTVETDTGINDDATRAHAIYPNLGDGARIVYDNSLFRANYYVLAGLPNAYIYTPGVWDDSGDLTVTIPANKAYAYPTQVMVVLKTVSNANIALINLVWATQQTLVFRPNGKVVDLVAFMGQSNMAGRGVTSTTWKEKAPLIGYDCGYEFRAISDPTKLYPAVEPFGVDENVTGAIDDRTADNDDAADGNSKKTGSCVVALMNVYHSISGVPIVGVSASEGGTTIADWQPNGARLDDAIDRYTAAQTWLNENGFIIRRQFMVWCQGENDANTSEEDYNAGFAAMFAAMQAVGVEKCFMCRIGEYNSGESTAYSNMIGIQTRLCQDTPDVIMATTTQASFRARGLMKDKYHYYQAGYNEMGRYAGANIANYYETQKEPTMYDPKYSDLYYSHKN